MNHLMYQNCKNKQLNITRKNRVLKVKNSPLKLENYFKPITTSLDVINECKGEEIVKQRTFTKNIQHNWFD